MLLINQVIHRKSIKKFTYIFIVISLSINLAACDSLSLSNVWHGKRPIAISAIANKNKNRSIYIKGKVIKIAPLLGNNAYQVQDDTGKIWVVTTKKLPVVGQEIYLKCNIKSQSLSSPNHNLDELYLVELERLEDD